MKPKTAEEKLDDALGGLLDEYYRRDMIAPRDEASDITALAMKRVREELHSLNIEAPDVLEHGPIVEADQTDGEGSDDLEQIFRKPN